MRHRQQRAAHVRVPVTVRRVAEVGHWQVDDDEPGAGLGDDPLDPRYFRREDESPDLLFDVEPRFTVHIDDQAIAAWLVTNETQHANIIVTSFHESGGWGEVSAQERNPRRPRSADPLYAVWARKE